MAYKSKYTGQQVDDGLELAYANDTKVKNLEDKVHDLEVSDGSRIDSEPTEAVIENIEPSLVSDALRKSEQHLTEDEKAQVRDNIDAQQELTLTILDNGNIRIGNLQGHIKDFMPATPSGDPMHYLYESAGAVYNNTDEDVVRVGEYGDIVHKAHHWYLNDLGDITNKEMCDIYRYTSGKIRTQNLAYAYSGLNVRTNIPVWDNIITAGSLSKNGSFNLHGACYGFKGTTFCFRKGSSVSDHGTTFLYLLSNVTGLATYSNVKYIIGWLNLNDITSALSEWVFGYAIIEVRIKNLRANLSINSNNLSYKSIITMIKYRTGTNDIILSLKQQALDNAMAAYLTDATQDIETYPTLADYALSKHVNLATI